MLRVNILHESSYNRNGEAFLFPLKYNHRRLLECGISLHFYSRITPSLMQCDVLCVSSKFFSHQWQNSSEAIIEFLVKAKKKVPKIIWFDISDSTGTTHFKVLPYVDSYLKNQVLKDRTAYQRTYYGSRIFTDFYHRHFGIEDENPGEVHLNLSPEDKDLQKIRVGWNSGMAHYGYYGAAFGKIWHKFSILPRFYPGRWWILSEERPMVCSCRIGESYSRETIAFSRREVKKRLLKRFRVEKVSRKKYFREMTQSIAVVSPFGLGEISCRDFEIIICGAAMVKQNMSHLETWPDLWIEDETYLPFAWDFSDFDDKIEFIFKCPEKMVELARNAGRIYKNLLCTKEGHQKFCERFAGIISNSA